MKKINLIICALILVLGSLFPEINSLKAQSSSTNQKPIIVSSKTFTESYLLAEIMAQALEAEGFEVVRTYGLGGTLVAYEALKKGSIDVYVEYSGTLAEVILKNTPLPEGPALKSILEKDGLATLPDFGFNNTYALTIKDTLAKSRNIKTISDLTTQTDLNISFGTEFMNREDGWPGLKSIYGLPFNPTGIEHGLAYQAIEEGHIQLTDAYSTDGDLERYKLVILLDDKSYFPSYYAFPFIRTDLPVSAQNVLTKLAGSLNDSQMRALNAEVVIGKRSFSDVAHEFLTDRGFATSTNGVPSLSDSIIKNTVVHLKLTGIALGLGIIVGLGLALFAFRYKNLSRGLLYITGLLQTIPSIALLALMIPLVGIGEVPAIIALFLYSLLPILRNSITGLVTIDPKLKRMAEALGLTQAQQLKHILVPLAFPQILAGIKTAAIISIGTATLAAFIGAGGLGEPIVTGLALNDTNLILQGALPAAGLAIIVEFLFEILEKLTVKEHMRLGKLSD